MRERLLPDALDGVELGDNVLELGPGPGLTTQALAPMTKHLTAIEIDPELAGYRGQSDSTKRKCRCRAG